MRAYYFDNIAGDQRLAHDSGRAVPTETLTSLGVLHWTIPIVQEQDVAQGEWLSEVDKVARERAYKNRDVIHLTRESLGDGYEEKMRMFYAEHMHDDEEIRYLLEGSGFFDVREHLTDAWIRLHLVAGDLIVLPAGIYHRFTLDEGECVRTMRLFKDEPKWMAHGRSEETDVNPRRVAYVRMISGVA